MLKKKGIEAASVLIKKVKSNLLEIYKLRADVEKILADVSSEDFGELKLKEWEEFDIMFFDHLTEIKDEV